MPSKIRPHCKRTCSYQSNRLSLLLGASEDQRAGCRGLELTKELRMRPKIIAITSLLLTLTASVAMAAPYCAVFAWGKQCDYVDYNECLRAAGTHGECVTNRQEDRAPSETAPYCLVTPYGTKCIYDDAPACRMAASIENSQLIKNASCVENPNR